MPAVELLANEQKLEGEVFGGNFQARTRLSQPLKYTGTLDSFKHQDLTPVLGREYEGLQARDLLKWGDEMIRDLAVTSKLTITVVTLRYTNALQVSQRGVVFLRDQDVTPNEMKDLMLRITELSGCVSLAVT